MRGRVGRFTAPIIGSRGGLPLLAEHGVWLWTQGGNLCLSCALLTKSQRVTKGRVEPASPAVMVPPSLSASCGVGIAGDGPPQAQGDFAKRTSL